MITRRDFDGSWPDLAGDVLAYATPGALVVARILPDGSSQPLWTQATPEPLMFVRAAAASGIVAAVGKGNITGAGYLVLAGNWEQLAPIAEGNNPIAIRAIGGGFVIRWIELNGIIATRHPDGSVTRDPIPAPWTETATGILDLAADGSAIYMDAARSRQVGAWTFSKPIERSGVIVGQTDPGGTVVPAIRVQVGGTVFTALEARDKVAEDPHLSVLENGRILVSAFTSRGASLAIVDPPYPANEVPMAPPPPVDPPKPPDQPKEPPVSVVPDYSSLVESLKLSLPLKQLGDLNDMADRVRNAKIAGGLAGGLTPAQALDYAEGTPEVQKAEGDVNQVKGACCQIIVTALNAHEGGQRWGCLRKDSGQHWTRSDGVNLSTDIAFCPSIPRLVDVMLDRGPIWDVHAPEDQQPIEKFVLPIADVVPPVVEPPAPPPPPPNPPPVPADTVSHAELNALRAELSTQIAALRQAVETRPSVDEAAVKALVAAALANVEVVGSTSRAFAHSHGINVTLRPRA